MNKLFVAILTHHRIDLLDRCIKSYYSAVQLVQLEVEPVIVVNTLSDEYYEEVLSKDYGGIRVVRTESNGLPGKGKNSCFELFLESDCDYLHQLDGDDFFYPSIFCSIWNHISRYPCIDVLALVPTDRADRFLHGSGHRFFVCGYEATVWGTSRVAPDGMPGPGRGSWVDAEWPSSPNTLNLYSRKGASYRMDEEQANGEDFLHSLLLLREHQKGNINFFLTMASDWYFHDGTVVNSIEKEHPWKAWIPIWREKALKIVDIEDSSFNELPTIYPELLMSCEEKEAWIKNNF